MNFNTQQSKNTAQLSQQVAERVKAFSKLVNEFLAHQAEVPAYKSDERANSTLFRTHR